MEKIDIIKLMKKNKKEQEKTHTNFEEELYIKLLYEYYDEYIHYNLLTLSKNGIISYKLNSDDIEEKEQAEDIKDFVLHTIQDIVKHSDTNTKDLNEKELQAFAYLDNLYSRQDDFYSKSMLADYYHKKGSDDLNLLETKDKAFKKEVANKICDVVIARTNTKAINTFYKKYVITTLDNLYKEKKIDFDITTTDDRTKKIKRNILSTLTSFIVELHELAEKNKVSKEDLPIFNFIFTEYEDVKQAMAQLFVGQFLEIYETKDFQDYLNSNDNSTYDIHLMTSKELEEHKKIIDKYNIIEQKTQEMMIYGVFNALKTLNKQGTIIFDMSSKNQRIETITKNIITYITKLFREMALTYLDNEEENKNKKVGIMEYLFLDMNEENYHKKSILLNGIIDMFLSYYPNIDFEDTDYIDNCDIVVYSSKEITEKELLDRIKNKMNIEIE